MIINYDSIERSDQNEFNEIPESGVEYLCPKCKSAEMNFDGLLNLYCQKCGYVNCGSFT